jgi:lipoprotein-anchoring transpeptidase ErfK/SrfK
MKQAIFIGFLFLLLMGIGFFIKPQANEAAIEKPWEGYWFLLHRKANREYFYYGIPGEKEKSTLLKIFVVKTGIPNERPTPLPQLLGRKYWIITNKESSSDNPETSPYFLTLDIPVNDEEPFGPTPYLECGGQCNWMLPGYFGLHGSGADPSKLSDENPGSSGCIRHTDEDITYLYNVLDPKKEEIRYYIEDV